MLLKPFTPAAGYLSYSVSVVLGRSREIRTLDQRIKSPLRYRCAILPNSTILKHTLPRFSRATIPIITPSAGLTFIFQNVPRDFRMCFNMVPYFACHAFGATRYSQRVSIPQSFCRPRARTWHTILVRNDANTSNLRCEPISAIAFYHIETHYQSPGFEPVSCIVYLDVCGRASNAFQYGPN